MTTVMGKIFDHGKELATYLAHLLKHDGHREVPVLIALLAADDQGNEPAKKAAALLLRNVGGQIGAMAVTDTNELADQIMTREETLASPSRNLIFEIVDYIVESDDSIKPFLEGAN
jgi:hypothetical protein